MPIFLLMLKPIFLVVAPGVLILVTMSKYLYKFIVL
jgi:hypothetical protein